MVVWAQSRVLRNCKSQILIFAKQFLHPSGAHDMSHACHTLSTPLLADSSYIES